MACSTSPGGQLTAHAAASAGLVDQLRAMLDQRPELVHDREPADGKCPLHEAGTIEVARLLLERGAKLDERDEDHDSPPVDWLICKAPDVARWLIEQGAEPNVFHAAMLGDEPMVARLIEQDPSVVGQWIGKAPWHSIGHRGRGGSVLQWTVGFNCFAHQVAARRGHHGVLKRLMDASDRRTRLLVACLTRDRETALQLAADDPSLMATMPDPERELLARYCWETNADVEAVRLMLDIGWPVAIPESAHGSSPLHNAAWGGYGELVELLIERGHPVDARDPTYGATPLGWAVHCATQDGRHPEGEYGRVARALVDAGATCDPAMYPTGHAAIDGVLASIC